MASVITVQAAAHPIKSVTVFKSSKAEVVRTFSLNFSKGQNKVQIRGLPSTIDTHSVRVSGLGEARLFDVVCTVGGSKAASYASDSSSEIIRTLIAKKLALESERATREQESQLLLKYAQTLSGEHVTPTQMGQFLESYVEMERNNLNARTELNEKIVEINRQIEAEQHKTSSKQGTAHGQVDIVITADEDTTIELKLTYIVSGAQWKPIYELHASTENGKPSSCVTLHYRARVMQSTGEDWTNAALTLSTIASDTIVRRIPQLRTITMRPKAPYTHFSQAPAFGLPMKANNVMASGGLFGANGAAAQSAPRFGASVIPFGSKVVQQGFGALVQQQQQQQTGSGLFGSAPAQPTTFSAFGAAGTTQSSQPFSSIFGQPQPEQMSSGAFGGGGQGTQIPPSGAGQRPQLFGAASATPQAPSAAYEAELAAAEAIPLPEEDDDFEAVPTPGAITEPTTIVSETPMAISFSVHGETTIPSDGVDHQVSVALLPFEAKISYITVPRMDPRVFLQASPNCEVKNSSEYRLLAGVVTVIFDDSYVSKTSINDIGTGDNFECTLGDDTSTKVTYAHTAGKAVESTGGAFAETSNTTTYTTKISVHNKHPFPLTDLIVREGLPVLEDTRAKVVLRKPAGLADARDGEVFHIGNEGLRVAWEKVIDGKGGEKEGKFEWRWKVGAGAKINLEAEWEVKVTGDTSWIEAFKQLSV